MKITAVRPIPVFYGSRNYLFVKIETDAGIYGIGEFGITWKEQAGIGAIKHMESDLIGQDPLNTEKLWQILFRGDFFPGGRINMAAQRAIDLINYCLEQIAKDSETGTIDIDRISSGISESVVIVSVIIVWLDLYSCESIFIKV